MPTQLPQAVPEIPVADVAIAAAYYVRSLGFQLDWHSKHDGIAGMSQGQCRLFLTSTAFRDYYGTTGPATAWLNLNSKAEVDELFQTWREAGAKILEEPEDKPWNLREFRVTDLDGNQLRVFYDFNWELKQDSA